MPDVILYVLAWTGVIALFIGGVFCIAYRNSYEDDE